MLHGKAGQGDNCQLSPLQQLIPQTLPHLEGQDIFRRPGGYALGAGSYFILGFRCPGPTGSCS